MRVKRIVAAAALGVAALASSATAASAHQEINPATFGVGKPIFLVLSSANERQSPITSISVSGPQGLVIGESSKDPAGWKVEHASGRVTWSGGSVAPGKFEQWGFEVEPPDQPGTFTFRVNLRYGDGRSDDAQVPVTVLAAGAAPTPTTPTAGPSPTTITTATAAGDSHSDGDADAEEAAAGQDSAARRRANQAMGIGIGALVVGLISLALAGRRPGRSGTAKTETKEQTW